MARRSTRRAFLARNATALVDSTTGSSKIYNRF